MYGKTEKSTKGVWRGKMFDVSDVPESWLRKVLFSEGLLPYVQGNARDAILPIDDDGVFLSNRDDIKWWRTASDKYTKNHGPKPPVTLEEQLDFGCKLSNQFPIQDNIVIYNKSGSDLCATRMTTGIPIFNTLYRVQTNSEDEALFLTAILNAECMQDTFRRTKKSPRHIDTHFWREVPIPRFDAGNANHRELAKLARRAENVAGAVPRTGMGTIKARVVIRNVLRDDGVSNLIDVVVAKIVDTSD